MSNFDVGEYLKVQAKAPYSFIDVSIKNAYSTIDSLSYFFYNKKHEWIAICFLDIDFKCHKIYVEKGEDNSMVSPKITITKAMYYAKKNKFCYIIFAHNHTLKPQILSHDGRRIVNIGTGEIGKKARLRFSESDKEVFKDWLEESRKYGIALAFCVFVAGSYHVEGSRDILKNISFNKPFF
jgi:hypothetical protein